MNKSIVFALKLLVISAVATFVLVLTNMATEPVIIEAKRQKELEAFSKVYEGLENVKPVEDQSVLNENIVSVNEAIVGGQPDGYIYTVNSPTGFDGPIQFVVGAKKDGTVTGLEVIAQSETKGFGAAVAEPEYAAGMKGVTLTQAIKAEGAGGGPDLMPAISGATRTTKAMEAAMNLVVEAQAKLTGTSVDTSVPITEVTQEQLLAAYPGAEETAAFEGGPVGDIVRAIYEAKQGGQTVGHVFHVLATDGYGGPIEYLIGVDKSGAIQGLSIVQQSETKGLGAKIDTPDYQDALKGQPVAPELGAITGATFTTKAMQSGFAAVKDAQAQLGQ